MDGVSPQSPSNPEFGPMRLAGSAAGIPEPERRKPQPPPAIADHTLIRRIGGGSYGEVWLARNIVGTLRAVKVVYRNTFEDDRPYEREFAGIQRFEPVSRTHDSLVDILQIGRNDEMGCFYYVMELADDAGADALGESPAAMRNLEMYSARTVRSELKRLQRLRVNECVRIGMSLTSALQHLHSHGLVHRDIKPSNIIFVNGVPKLADIGLVAEVGEARSFVGTTGFIPPEGPGTPQADLYSLGKVLYEMATGMDRQEFPKLPPHLRELPDAEELVEFNEIVLKACEDDWQCRYASADSMQQDLALLQAGKSIQHFRQVQRRLAIFHRAVAVAGVLLLIAAGLYWAARAQALSTRRQLYVAEMNLAFQAWDAGNVPRAKALLGKHRAAEPGLRGFEWRLLENLCGENDARFTLRGHTGRVWGMAISPDGQRVVSAGADGSLKVWAATTGALLTNLVEPGVIIHSVAFSPDGQRLASGGRDNLVTLRDAASFQVQHRLRAHQDAVRALAFAPDGNWLASGGEDRRIILWEPVRGTLAQEFVETMTVESLVFAPDGSLLAAAGTDARAHLWDLAKAEKRSVAMQRALLKAVAFSPDGLTLAAAGYEGITELWDLSRDQSLGVIGGGPPVEAVAFSPDGRWLATAGSDATIQLWNVRTRQRERQWRGHTAGVNTLTFAPNGDVLLSASDDGTARLWEVQSIVQRQRALAHPGLVNSMAFDSTSRFLATASGQSDELRLWDTGTGKELIGIRGKPFSIWCLAGTSDQKIIFTGGVDGWLRRWDMAARRPSHTRKVHDYAIEAVALSPDGRTIATAGRGTRIELWDSDTLGPIATLPGEAQVFRAVAFSPDGQQLAAGGRPQEVWLWNIATRTLAAKLSGHPSEVWSVAFSPDGTMLAVGDNGRVIHLWELKAKKLRARLEGHDAPVNSLAFSPDGATLASGSNDSTVKLWNFQLLQEVATLRGHASQVRQVAFSPDGNLLASAGGDGRVRLWRASHSDLRKR